MLLWKAFLRFNVVTWWCLDRLLKIPVEYKLKCVHSYVSAKNSIEVSEETWAVMGFAASEHTTLSYLLSPWSGL